MKVAMKSQILQLAATVLVLSAMSASTAIRYVNVNSAATEGGGAWGGTLNYCTLTGNSAASEGGGVSGCTLNNCIVYYNSVLRLVAAIQFAHRWLGESDPLGR